MELVQLKLMIRVNGMTVMCFINNDTPWFETTKYLRNKMSIDTKTQNQFFHNHKNVG